MHLQQPQTAPRLPLFGPIPDAQDAVLDALQTKKETADIPVIVVTAKDLTQEEKNRLKGHIQSLMQKGDFMSDELIEEVRNLSG